MDWLINNIIAILALFVAAWSFYKNLGFNNVQNNLQRRVVELEEARHAQKEKEENQANLIAREVLKQAWTGKNKHVLTIVNTGLAEARNVRLKVNDQLPSKHDFIITNTDEVKVIAPKGEYDFNIAKAKIMDHEWNIELKWDDDSEKGRIWKTNIRV